MSSNSKQLKVYIPHLESEFVTNASTLTELLDEAIRNGLPSTIRKSVNVFWKDKDDDDVCIYNEKSFEAFRRMPERTIWIKFPQEGHPLKITLEINGVRHVIYSFARSYQLLLEDLDGLFDIRFPNDDYVISYKDEFIICNQRTFLEASLEKTLHVKRMAYDLDIQFQINGQSHMIRSHARSYQQLIEEVNGLFGIKFPSEEYHIIFEKDHDKMVICNQNMFAEFLEGVSLIPRKIKIRKDESVFKIISKNNKSITRGFSAAVSYDKLLVNIDKMIGKRENPHIELSLFWRYMSEEIFLINNANFDLFLKYGSKELESLLSYKINYYKDYPIKIVSGGRKYIINPVDDYDDLLKEIRINCGDNTNNLRISYTYDEKLEPREGHIQDRTTFEDFKTRLNRDASPKVMHTIQVQNE